MIQIPRDTVISDFFITDIIPSYYGQSIRMGKNLADL